MKFSSRRAFTLIEILVVIAIIAIIAGIIYPVVARAKMAAYKTTSISNLRQCMDALIIYETDNGDFPVGQGAFDALAKSPTCDPKDVWRSTCKVEWGAPLVGSYAYIRLVNGYDSAEQWTDVIQNRPSPALVASVWYASNRLEPFHGDSPTAITNCLARNSCWLPDRIIYGRIDGSAKVRTFKSMVQESASEQRGQVFTWGNVFAEDNSQP